MFSYWSKPVNEEERRARVGEVAKWRGREREGERESGKMIAYKDIQI